MNVPRDICKVLIDEQGLQADKLPESWKMFASKHASEVDVQNSINMIDALVLLANSDKLLSLMHKIELESLLPLIKLPPSVDEDISIRIEVLINQLTTVKDEVKAAEEEALPGLEDQ